MSSYQPRAIDPSATQACYPSTISSAPFSLLCCQPKAVRVSLMPSTCPRYQGPPIATRNLEWAGSQYSAMQILRHVAILFHRFMSPTRVTGLRYQTLTI